MLIFMEINVPFADASVSIFAAEWPCQHLPAGVEAVGLLPNHYSPNKTHSNDQNPTVEDTFARSAWSQTCQCVRWLACVLLSYISESKFPFMQCALQRQKYWKRFVLARNFQSKPTNCFLEVCRRTK
jgi:hypothetical protein